MTIGCRWIDWSEWLSDRSRHDELLSRSEADAIFSSSHWLGAWWNVFGDLNAALPRTAAAFVGDSLIAFLPVAMRERRLRGAFRITSLQPLGAGWRESDVALSEYLGPVVDAQADAGAVDALLRFVLQEGRADEVVFPHADLRKPWLAALERVAAEHGFHFRIADRTSAYRIDLTHGFAHYIALLSANSRRKLITQRRKLEALGDVSLHTYAANELDAGIEALNSLGEMRWGTPLFDDRRLRFHLEVLRSLHPPWHADVRTLAVGQRVIAASYDLGYGLHRHNIALTFDPGFAASASPGLLHLGYCLEAAARSGVTGYDLLAGEGMHTDYKRRIASSRVDVGAVQVIRSKALRATYRVYDRFRRARGLPVPSVE
jgi:CelD/BcsL family acetyltransferase involved in cellulose biosynthesis